MVCNGDRSIKVFEKNGYDLVKCETDGHLYVSNPPSLDELSGLYSEAYFEETQERSTILACTLCDSLGGHGRSRSISASC